MTGAPPGGAVAARIIRCPRCGGRSVYAPDRPYRPFCSERCRSADFGAWASEEFRVDTAPPLGEGHGVEIDPIGRSHGETRTPET